MGVRRRRSFSPSCRAPQGHNQTPENFVFLQYWFKISTCGGRKSTILQLATPSPSQVCFCSTCSRCKSKKNKGILIKKEKQNGQKETSEKKYWEGRLAAAASRSKIQLHCFSK